MCFGSELKQTSQDTYRNNFDVSNIKFCDDVKKLNKNTIPQYDILFAGFPCQPFSQAGNRKGFDDEKNGNLFLELDRIITETKPKMILLENVKGILYNDNGKTIKFINDTISNWDNGNYVTTEENLLISPREYGYLQNRERVFFMIIHKDYLNKEFSYIKNNKLFLKKPELKYNKQILKECDDYPETLKINGMTNKIINSLDDLVKNTNIRGYIFTKYFGKKLEDVEKMQEKKWRLPLIKRSIAIYEDNKEFLDKWLIRHDVRNWTNYKQTLIIRNEGNRNINDCILQFRISGCVLHSKSKFPTLTTKEGLILINKKKISHNKRIEETSNIS